MKKDSLISAFTPPPNGWVRAYKNGVVYDEKFYEDFRTYERYKEYRDCGFDEIMFAGETKYLGEDYETSDLKKMLDLSAACDLNALVYDGRILNLTVQAKKSIIGELFDTEEALDEYLKECVKDYSKHPAFYGIVIIDEPFIERVQVVHQIAKAMKRVLPNAFVHTCFNPLSCVDGGPMQETVLGKDGDGYEAYGYYIDQMSVPELGYWGYDDYPFKHAEGVPMIEKYITTQQFVANRCKKNNLPFHFTMQSYTNNVIDKKKGTPRMLDKDDLFWVANLALGFGVKKFYYYTYWRFTSRGALNAPDIAIMDDDGSKILYDEVQQTNALIHKVFPQIADFVYEGSQYFDAENGNDSTIGLISEDLNFFSDCASEAPLLLNKLSNGKKNAYMLFNVRAPWEKEFNRVKVCFKESTSKVKTMVNGEIVDVEIPPCDKDCINFMLRPGEAVWFFED